MALSSGQLNSKTSRLLVDGYCKDIVYSIPIPIFTLCHQFYNEAIFWKINTNDLANKVSNNIKSKTINGPVHDINGILIECRLQISNNHIIFGLYLKYLPENVMNVNCRFRLFCEETQTEYRRGILFNENTIGQCIRSWREKALSISECINYKLVTFSSYIDVLCINYYNKISFIRSISMDKTINYKWNISDEMMNIFRNCTHGQLFYPSDNFGIDQNFCICIGPNDRKGSCMLFVQILAMPYGVKSIEANILFEVKANGFYRKWQAKGGIVDFAHWPLNTLTYTDLIRLRDVSLSVTLQIFRSNK